MQKAIKALSDIHSNKLGYTVLAYDLGRHCGFAYTKNGEVFYGTKDIRSKAWEQEFSLWTIENEATINPLMVCVEKPNAGIPGFHAKKIHFGMRALIEVAHGRTVPIKDYSAKAVKKFVTGNGNASKEEMLKCISEITKTEVKTFDEADAIGILLNFVSDIILP